MYMKQKVLQVFLLTPFSVIFYTLNGFRCLGGCSNFTHYTVQIVAGLIIFNWLLFFIYINAKDEKFKSRLKVAFLVCIFLVLFGLADFGLGHTDFAKNFSYNR